LNQYNIEAVWCQISTGSNSDLYIGVVYKSPSAAESEIKELHSALRNISVKDVVIMGDFNYPGINWITLDCDSGCVEFLDLVQDTFLTQHVLTPTRENNILDLVLSSEEGMVEDLQVLEHLANSDHNIVKFKLVHATASVSSCQVKFDYNKGDYIQMNSWLSAVSWDDSFQNLEVNEMWNTFHDTISSAVEKFIPKQKPRSKKYASWMTCKAKRARKFKSRMWIRYAKSKSYNDYIEYKRALNKATYEYKKAKTNFEKKLADNIKDNPKSFYSYVRSKSRTKDKVGPLKDKFGNTVIDDEGMCNILNGYFSSVFTDEISLGAILPDTESKFRKDLYNVLPDFSISVEIIIQTLKNLSLNKSPGVDGLVPKVLVETAVNIGKPLHAIFNKSLCVGVVPNDWKRANICAIYKKGSKSDACNYRPVSLTSHVCKVMETIIKNRLTLHLYQYKLIHSTQHGFMKNRSCLTNLLEFLEYICSFVDKGQPIDVIYLDFQKAFDKVPHRRLISKLHAVGIEGQVAVWIENWLANREQRVVLNGNMSEWCSVISGVPQGSVLGPLLFLIYINDIDVCVSSKLLKFADDAKLFRVVSSVDEVEKLRNDLTNLCSWSADWLMLFNLDKCKVMHLGRNNPKQQYSMEGKTLNVVHEERDLGVIVQDDLKVSQQCSKVVKTANRVLGMIYRSFTYKSKDVVLQLYKSLVRPHLEFCVQAWRPHLQKDIMLLEKVQRRATRMIDNFQKLSYEERLSKLKLTTLETRRLRGDLIETFKIFKGFTDVNKDNFFDLSSGSLRGHSLKLFKSRFVTNCGKFMFSNRVVDEWNLLTEDIVSCDTVNGFKNKLDRYLEYCRGFK
jgi:ribonucleases P/MRP protein subunit RPP40